MQSGFARSLLRADLGLLQLFLEPPRPANSRSVHEAGPCPVHPQPSPSEDAAPSPLFQVDVFDATQVHFPSPPINPSALVNQSSVRDRDFPSPQQDPHKRIDLRRPMPSDRSAIEARQKAIRARVAKKERARDTRRKILVGILLLHRMENDPENGPRFRLWLRKELPGFLGEGNNTEE